MLKLVGQVFRATYRILRWLFLLTLPLTALPLLQGSIAGVVSGLFAAKHLQTAFSAMDGELQDIGGGPSQFTGTTTITRREYQDWHNNFHIQRLNIDWAAHLCMRTPLQCGLFETGDCSDKGNGVVAMPGGLMYWTACSPERDRETWIYLTNTARPSVNEWDAAFDEVIMRAYADTSASAPALHFMNCNDTGAFSCGAWLTRAPALVHFVINDEELGDTQLTYDKPLSELRPVTAQIIEFPLQDETYLGLPANMFPSRAQQMLAVVYGGVWEQFDAFDGLEQYNKRSNEAIDAFFRQPGTVFYPLDKLTDRLFDDFMTPLGIEVVYQYANGIAYSLTSLFSAILFVAYGSLVATFKLYIKPTLFDSDDLVTSGTNDNFWTGINDEAWSASLDRKQSSFKADMSRFIASLATKLEEAEAVTVTTDSLWGASIAASDENLPTAG